MEDSQSIETVAKAAKVELEALMPKFKPRTLEDRIVDLEAQVKWLMGLGARARFKSKSKKGFSPFPEDKRVFEELCQAFMFTPQAVLAKCRTDEAVARRDKIMFELDRLGWDEYRIANVFGMSRSNVSYALARISIGKSK